MLMMVLFLELVVRLVGFLIPLSYSDPKKNTGDYHDEMTADHFEEWFATKLLPNVPANSLIIMDNATYHSRRSDPVPVKSRTKKDARLALGKEN